MEKSFLCFGRYEGVWRNSDTGFECELVIDENNFKPHTEIKQYPYSFDGFLEWRSTVVPADIKSNGKAFNKIAMEKVRGFYYTENSDKNHHFICMGFEAYQSIHPDICGTEYSCDGYKFDLNPAYKTIESFACNRGKWDTNITIKRVASKNELIELLTDKFGNEKGIVGIVSDMLHKFIPPIIAIQKINTIDYQLEIRELVSYQNPILKPLFSDICNYDEEILVVVKSKPETMIPGGLKLNIGDECVIIYKHVNDWCYGIYNDGKEKDIVIGWIHSRHIEHM
eukprot:179888_1